MKPIKCLNRYCDRQINRDMRGRKKRKYCKACGYARLVGQNYSHKKHNLAKNKKI